MSDNNLVELFENNAGGLAVRHNGKVYRGFERDEDGTTFEDIALILLGEIGGDVNHMESDYQIEDERELVATWCPGDRYLLAGDIGIAGRRFLG